MNKVYLIIISVLVCTIIALRSDFIAIRASYSDAMTNVKALTELSNNKDKEIRVLRLSNELLSYYNGSIIHKMDSVKKLLKKKDVSMISYLKETIVRTDTLVLKDTIFIEGTCMDTTLCDEWYSLHLSLCYPSRLEVTPKFVSSGYFIYSYTKETINPPKRFWLLRLFLKKHKVLKVDYIQENPYISTEINKHIEIVD